MHSVKNQDFRTELNKARGSGSGHAGTGHYIMQRSLAVANVPLFIFFIGLIVACGGKNYDQIHALFANPFIAAVTALILVSGIYHMKLGMQVILEDYIHSKTLRLWALMINSFCSVFLIAAAFAALIKIMLGV